MTEAKTKGLLNSLFDLKLKKAKGKFCSYDAEDSKHIVEIKNRRSYYPTKMIEASKLFTNFQKAQKLNKYFIYVVTDKKGLFIFNISNRIDDIIALGIQKSEQPSSTDFNIRTPIYKYYYNLPEDMVVEKRIIE
tara:strand:+ start:3960 stop:4361 length:402 start_codon:yes stop_codon:yes gene_type:complete